MKLPINDMIEEPVEPLRPFMGISIGTDGVPIDAIRIHLLGSALEDFAILLADEFSSERIAGKTGLNDKDLMHAKRRYSDALDLFQIVWPNQRRTISASDIMGTEDYRKALSDVEAMIKEQGLEAQIAALQTDRGNTPEDRRRYALSEMAVVEYLRRHHGFGTKIGQHSERKYDLIMAKISFGMRFAYLHTAHALSQSSEEPSPYLVGSINTIPNKRILISDDPDTVEEKLKLGTTKAHRYFAVLGSLAGRANGKECALPEVILSMSREELAQLAQTYVLDNIIAPLRRAAGVSIYRKTAMRRIYDQTYMRAKYKFLERAPDLAKVVRPELDSITEQLLCLLSQRQRYVVPDNYDEGFPHRADVGILAEIPSEIYAPILSMLPKGPPSLPNPPEGLDLEMMELLQRRILLGYNVAIAKLRSGKSVYDGEREQAVLHSAESRGKEYGLDPGATGRLIQFIMDKTKELQETVISRYELDFCG